MEIQKIKKMGTIIIEAPEVEAVVIDGGLFVKVMDLPAVSESTDQPSAKVVDDTKKSVKTATKEKEPVKEEKKVPAKLKLVKNWASLKEGDSVQVKLAEEYLAEGDDPARMYVCEVKSVDSDEVVSVELIFKDEDLDGSESMINSEDGSEIYKI